MKWYYTQGDCLGWNGTAWQRFGDDSEYREWYRENIGED